MIVTDCTFITQFFLATPDTDLVRSIAQVEDAWLVPPLWRSEFRSVLRKYVLASKLTLADSLEIIRLAETRLSKSEVEVSSSDVMDLVASSRCSAYDAEYLSLAKTFSVPLVTSDKRLCEAFPPLAISPAGFLSASKGGA